MSTAYPFAASTTVDSDVTADKGTKEGDATVYQPSAASPPEESSQQCCLVQIYPVDVIHGLCLFQSDRVLAGRDAHCELRLGDSSVSRQHAEFLRDEVGYRIHDLASTNGTWVNGVSVTDHRLTSGDTVKLGSFIFKFLSAGSIESQYHETVYSVMTRDALTGTMNKRYLLEAMQRELARSVRQQKTLAVMMLDIDHFKRVNDSHGHLVGDEVLKEFGRRILAICRADDLLARYGGEEFCLLMADTQLDEAIEMAQRFRAAIADRPFPTAVGPLSITASFGVASLDVANESQVVTPEMMMGRADQRLYQAKESGRNRVVA